MDRQEFLDLAPAHALGLLEGSERERFERALAAADPELKAAYDRAVRTASHLSLAAPEAPPLSPDVLGRLMARIETSPRPEAAERDSEVRAPRPAGRVGDPVSVGGSASAAPKPRIAFLLPLWAWAGATVALAAFSLGLLVYLSSLRGHLGSQQAVIADVRQRIEALEDTLAQREALLDVIRSNQMQVAVMAGQDPNPAGYGKILWDPERKRAILHVSNLPPIPKDKDYQLWVIRDSKPVDAGVFHVGAKREGGDLFRIDQLVEADRSRINAFAVTLEPKGGVPQPSGKMYLLGSI